MANTADSTAIGELRGLYSLAAAEDYMKHSVTWDRERWLVQDPLVYKGGGKQRIGKRTELTKLWEHREFVERQPVPISRADVFSVFKRAADNTERLTEAFLLSMIWGFGPSPYGPYRTSVMLESGGENLGKMLAEIVLLLNRDNRADADVEVAYRKLLKFEQCGPAFATKFMYFASPEASRIPIFDKRVANWLTTAGRDDATSHGKRLSATQHHHFPEYFRFCREAAVKLEISDVGLVEYLMFVDHKASTLQAERDALPMWIRRVRFPEPMR